MDNQCEMSNAKRVKRSSNASTKESSRRVILTTVEAKRQRNRTAQAAFRERRNEYVKELEAEMKQLQREVKELRAARSGSADEILMLRYDNSLLSRLLIEHGVDVHAAFGEAKQQTKTFHKPQRRKERPQSAQVNVQGTQVLDSWSPTSSMSSSSHSSASINSIFGESDHSTPISIHPSEEIDWKTPQPPQSKMPTGKLCGAPVGEVSSFEQLSGKLIGHAARPEDEYGFLVATGLCPISNDPSKGMEQYDETMISELSNSEQFDSSSFLDSIDFLGTLPF